MPSQSSSSFFFFSLMAITRCRSIHQGAPQWNPCKHIHKTAAGDQPVQPSIGSLVASPFPNKHRHPLKWNKQRQRAKRSSGEENGVHVCFRASGWTWNKQRKKSCGSKHATTETSMTFYHFQSVSKVKTGCDTSFVSMTFTSWIWTFWYLAWAHFWWEWI